MDLPQRVWRVLRRHRPSTRAKRLSLVAGEAAPPEPERPRQPEPERHLGELHVRPPNPSARWTSHLAQVVARCLASRGWELEAVMSENASEFHSGEFRSAVARLGAQHVFIRAGRPQTNACVERAQGAILWEC